jgi:hypothetical protein
MPKKTHIPIAGSLMTYCGLRYSDGSIAVINLKRDSIESATCRNCQRSDDRRVVANHRRECRETNIDPVAMQPLQKVKP